MTLIEREKLKLYKLYRLTHAWNENQAELIPMCHNKSSSLGKYKKYTLKTS